MCPEPVLHTEIALTEFQCGNSLIKTSSNNCGKTNVDGTRAKPKIESVTSMSAARTLAEGANLDLEHLTRYNKMGAEFDELIPFINAIRTNLNPVAKAERQMPRQRKTL